MASPAVSPATPARGFFTDLSRADLDQLRTVIQTIKGKVTDKDQLPGYVYATKDDSDGLVKIGW